MIGRLKFRTEEARKRERIRVGLRFAFISLSTFSVLVLIFFACHQDFLRIKNTYVQTDGVLTELEVASVIQSEIDGTFFGVFPKDSALLPQTDILEKKIYTEFPRVSQAVVRRAGMHTLSATIVERVPEALWCGDVVPTVAYKEISDEERVKEELWGTCYLVDKGGYIYAKAPIYSGNVFPRYYGSLKSGEPIAQQFVPESEFSAWQKFYASLARNDIFPQALLFVDERDVEVYLSNGLRILVPREEGPDVTYTRLLALLESDSLDVSREIEYVDFRFGTKVFVKYSKENV
jgi:cell division septal protein FtsQ